MVEIKLYKSTKKALRLFALGLPFITIGIWVVTRNNTSNYDTAMGWITICFFGLSIPIGLFHLFDKRPQVILNEFGIFDRTTHSEFINWEIIKEAYPKNIHNQHFISLVVTEKFKPSKKKGLFYKNVTKLNEGLGFQELNIQLGQLDIDTIKLTNIIVIMANATPSKRAELIKKSAPSREFQV